jgi:hypothetical protein
MTKYLDSKGLSYLWQKIVHRFAQRDLTNLTKLAQGNIALWTDEHKLSGVTPKDLAGSVLAEEYIELPDGSLVQHVQSGLGASDDKSGWALPEASTKFGVVATESTVSSADGLTPLPIIDGKLYYRDGADYTHPELNIKKTSTTGAPAHSGTFTIIDGLTFAETQEGGAEKGHLVGYTTKEITLPAGYVHPTPTLKPETAESTLAHAGTFTAITGITVNTEGHTTGVKTTTYTLPGGYVHPGVETDDSTSTAAPEHGGTFTVIDSVKRDDKGHVTGVNTKTVTLPTVPEVVIPIVGVDDPNAILHLDSEKELYTSLKLHRPEGTTKIQILGSKTGSFPKGDNVSDGGKYPVVTELDLTDLTKDSFLKSATIHTLSAGADGQDATLSWDVQPAGGSVPTAPGTYIRFEWNTREDDAATKDKVETTVEYLDVTRLISIYNPGNGIDITDYNGYDGKGKNAKSISVKVDNTTPADGGTLVTLTAGTNGLSAKVDLSAYQKSADLVAFTKDELDAIFAEAEVDLTVNKGVPTFPADPLVKE